MWKGLALVLALCMLPTVAFAETGATLEATVTKSGEEVSPATITVEATIGVPGNDVTVLAYRAKDVSATAPDISGEGAINPNAIVYIDQVTSDKTTGAISLTFIPREVTAPGNYINVFVGGKDVTSLAFQQLDFAPALPAAPAVEAPEKLYKGDALELTLTAPEDESFNMDDWYATISVSVNGDKLLTKDTDYTLNAEKTALVIEYDKIVELEITTITSIAITSEAYQAVPEITETLTWSDFPAGAFTAALPTEIIAGESINIPVANADATYGDDWNAALAEAATVTLGDAEVTVNSYTEGNLNIIVDFKAEGKAENAGVSGNLAIAVADYETLTSEATIAVIPPTTAAAKGVTIPDEAYADAEFYPIDGTYPEDPEVKKAMYGHIYLDVSAISAAEYGTSVEWSVVPKAGGDALTASAEGVYDLTRSADGSVVYTVTATVKKDGYIDDTTVTKDITVDQIGVEVPENPSITAPVVAVKEEDALLVAGNTAVAHYEFEDGSFFEYTDGSEITWYTADDKETAIGTGKELLIADAYVGKKLTYSALAKVAEERENGVANELKWAEESAIVMPATGYAPTATKKDAETLDITPTIAVDVTEYFTLDSDKYVNAVYGATYAWFEKGEGDAWTAITDEAIAGKANVVFGPEWINKVVKVTVTPTIKVGDADPVSGAPIEFEGTVSSDAPVLTINEAKLATKKIYAGSNFSISDVTATSQVPEGTSTDVELAYTWFIVDAADAETFDPLNTEATPAGTGATLAVPKDTEETPVIGKMVFVKIVATDAFGVSTTGSYAFPNAIVKKNTNTAATGTGAVLPSTTTTPGTDKPGTETPGTETPGTDKPSTDVKEDPAGTANDKGAAVFTDVNKETYAWAYEGIDALTKAGVIKGMTETTFGPELTATNAQMIALAVRIAGLTAEGATTDKVDASHWVAAELAVADAKGILSVYGDKIDVEAATTREIAFTLLYNALKAAGVTLPETAEAIEFTDASSIDANCVEAINALVKAGIVNGMGDGTLAPKATLTRAQLAKILGLANAIVAK